MIDYDLLWKYLPRFSHAEALTLLAFARLWETGDEPEGDSERRLMSAEVADLAGIAEGTAAGALRKLSGPVGPVEGGEDRTVCPALLRPDYFLGSAPDGKVPPTRVGCVPTLDLLATTATVDVPEIADRFTSDPGRPDDDGPDPVPART